MTRRERAAALFMEGYSCAQAVFGAFSDVTGFDETTALRLSSAFGAGMGRMREVCGTCSGMFMGIGVLFGHSDPDPQTKADVYARVQDLAQRFRERNRTIVCRELLAGIRTDTRPLPDARTEEYYRVRPCIRFVTEAADILDEYLKENGVLTDE